MFHINFKIELPENIDGSCSNNSSPTNNYTNYLTGKYDLAAYLNLNGGGGGGGHGGQAKHGTGYGNNNKQPPVYQPRSSNTNPNKSNNNSQLGNYFIREEADLDDDYYYNQPPPQQQQQQLHNNSNKLNGINGNRSHNYLTNQNNHLNDSNWRLNMIRQKQNSQLSNSSSYHFNSNPTGNQHHPPPPHNISSDLGYYTDYYSQASKNAHRLRLANNHTSNEIYPDHNLNNKPRGVNNTYNANETSFAGEVRYYGNKRVSIDSRASDRSNDSMSKLLNNYYPSYFGNNNPTQPPKATSNLTKRSSFISNNSTASSNNAANKKATNQNESVSSAEEKQLANSKTQLPTLNQRNNNLAKKLPENAAALNMLPGIAAKANSNTNANLTKNTNPAASYAMLSQSQTGQGVNAATMEYINMLGNPNAVPKYYTETVKLNPPERRVNPPGGGRKLEANYYSNKGDGYYGSYVNNNKHGSNVAANPPTKQSMQRFQEYKNVSFLFFENSEILRGKFSSL
jgi:hypothetical protein